MESSEMHIPARVRRSHHVRHLALICVTLAALAATVSAQVPERTPAWLPAEARYALPLLPGQKYDAAVPPPQTILGYELGSRPVTHAELSRCLDAYAQSPRISLHEYARSHEQRKLWYAVVTSPANQHRLAEIRAAIGRLADPRTLRDDAAAQQLIADTPAVAWMAYSIHGDELSSTDAAVGLLYHLAACQDDDVQALLDEVVVIIDPLMNPDGRDRFISMIDQFRGYVPNLDAGSLQHGGRWPWGRGNHYYFDLNRDWLAGVHPETRGRQAALVQWNPQLLVDSHEMGPDDTYLFNPPREPFHPNLSPIIRKWWRTFADDQARAFDRFGWSYYTREWLEFWYPGYSDAWVAFRGGIGILYEQARVAGHPLRQSTGQILTYRECVHHQLVSSLANLETLRVHRAEILSDFLQQAREALRPDTGDGRETFVLVPGPNASRIRGFLQNLVRQGIEVRVAAKAFQAYRVVSSLRETIGDREFPAGSYLIARRQPAGPLVGALLDFDPRMADDFLQQEREELERKRESKLYDVTGWSLPLAAGLESYWISDELPADAKPLALTEARAGLGEEPTGRPYGYVLDCGDDAWGPALAYLLQTGVTVRVSLEDFRAGGRAFPRGSLLARVSENGPDLWHHVQHVAQTTGVPVHAAPTARSPDDGPDLGGNRFALLVAPRIALLGDAPVGPGSFGTIWHLLDHELSLAVPLLGVQGRGADLRQYNVVILPSAWNPDKAYGDWVDGLKEWVSAGGTLIAIGESASFLADAERGLSEVRRREDVLGDLPAYTYAADLEWAAGTQTVNPAAVWDVPVETAPTSMPASTQPADEQAKALDEWRRVFAPQGTIVRGRLNMDHWLTSGCPEQMPLFAAGGRVLLAKHPVATPVRFTDAEHLRLSGLLWPEAALRLEKSAYATVERVGNGQVILFAHEPDFRGYWYGSRRLFVNAVLLGPGCGTNPPRPPALPE